MTEVIRCDRCGEYERYTSKVATIEQPRRVWATATYEDAVGGHKEPDLCIDCSRELQRWIQDTRP